MTPLRWRSTSMKELQNSQGHTFAEPSVQSPADIGQSSGETPAPLAEQLNHHLSADSTRSAKHSRSLPDAVPSPEPNRQGESDSISLVEEAQSRSNETTPAATPTTRAMSPRELPRSGLVRNLSMSGADTKSSIEGSPEPRQGPTEEIVEFQPVDLDQKYRRKELIRHVTAAKIQNREESLLNNPSLPVLEARKAPTGDEPAAMTIEFLRARLLAERSASKATKQQMSQLSKKVVDLETRLAAEVELRQAEMELRKKAEVALQEALAKLNQISTVGETVVKEASTVSTVDLQTAKNAQPKASDENAPQMKPGAFNESSKQTVVRSEADPDSTSLPENIVSNQDKVSSVNGVTNESASTQTNSPAAAPTQASERTSLQGSSGYRSKSPDTSDSGSSPERDASSSNQSKTREDTRTAIEERLRTMWRQIGQEMAALAEVKGGEDSIKQEFMGWMGQVPKMLKDEQSETSKGVNGAKLGVILPDIGVNATEDSLGAVLEEGSNQDNSAKILSPSAEKTESLKRNASIAKKVAKLVEQYEAQETAQRAWEENFEAQHSREQDEDELPPLVTADGDVISENGPSKDLLSSKPGAKPVTHAENSANVPLPTLSKSKSFDMSSHIETNLLKSKSFDSSIKPAISRSRTKSFDLSHDTTSGNAPRRASFNGRIEIIDDQPADNIVDEDLIDDEDAEELPNGIYLHHSRDEDDSYSRAAKDKYGRTPERVSANRGFHSPGSRSDRGQHTNGYMSPGGRSDRVPHARERFSSHGGPVDSMAEVDSQGWPMREVKDRASRDVYYAPVMNTRNPRGDTGPYSHSEREYPHRSRTERSPDEPLSRNGPGSRWDPNMADSSWVQRQEERRMSDPHYSHSSSEDGTGGPIPSSERDMRGPYSYPDRDPLDHDMQYRNTYKQRGEAGPRGDVYRGMPSPWQETENPSMMRSRSMGQRPYAYPPPYSYEEPHLAQNIEAGGGYNNYHGRPEMHYPPHVSLNRPDYYPQYGGPRSSMNGYHSSRPETPPSVNRGYTGWDTGSPQLERSAPVVPSDDVPGEAGEVLKALRMAKQQIRSTGEQASYMTAQYTVSSEHRYGNGGQISKTSYTVEAPVGYPRITKTIQEGWHLEGNSSRLGGVDVRGANVSDLITSSGPLTVTNGEASYVEKLNVGRGIQFFFS